MIGTELHDNINQMLTVTKLLVDTVINKGSREDLLQMCLNNLRMITEEVRRLSYSLVGYELMEFGLNHAIHSLVHTIGLGTSIRFHLHLDDAFEHSLTTNHQLHLYRIVQEAVTNILKHAQATDVHITFDQKDNLSAQLVKDNGKGFHLDRLKRSVGLASMTQRITLLKGHFNLHIHFPV